MAYGLQIVYAILVFVSPLLAVTVLTTPDELKTFHYDFVVVGGGTAVSSSLKLG